MLLRTPRQKAAARLLAARKKNKINWFSTSFPAQLKFILDPAPLKAGLCTRRAGKSTGCGELAVKVAHTTPYCSIGLIGKTKASIQNIYFKDIFRPIFDRLKWVEDVDYVIHKTNRTVTLSNGSIIYLEGADASEDEMTKFLGQKYALVIVDEASMYKNIDLKALVHDILEPAVADYSGQIILIGTPSNYVGSYFHKVTTGQVPGWSVHTWTWKDNPHVVKQISALVDRMIAANPDVVNDPGFKQMYLAEWAVEKSSRVYKYDSTVNGIDSKRLSGWQHVIGVDLGWNDATSFTVVAWSHHERAMHIVWSEKQSKLTLDRVEARLKALQSEYSARVIVVDGASKQFVETLQERFGVGLVRAEKLNKKDYIELFNTDLMLKHVLVHTSTCEPLIKEWETLIWDEEALEKGKWEELKSKDNHACDSALYAWRWCYNYAAIPREPALSEDEKQEQAAIESIQRASLSYEDKYYVESIEDIGGF